MLLSTVHLNPEGRYGFQTSTNAFGRRHIVAFVCHHNSLLIYGSLKTPTIDRFARVTHYSTSISMVACLVMALAGFLTFGDKTVGNVLNNFPANNVMVNVARLFFGLNMLTTLPLEAFVCREVMFNFFYPDAPFNLVLHVLFSSGLVVGAMLLSLLTCDLGAVFELVGATSACALAYILPPMCYIKLTTRSWKTYAAGGILAFGVMVLVVSLVQAVGKFISGESFPPSRRCSFLCGDGLTRKGQGEELRHNACEEVGKEPTGFFGIYFALLFPFLLCGGFFLGKWYTRLYFP